LSLPSECGSKYFQAGGSDVLIKFCDAFGVTAEQRFNGDHSLISASQRPSFPYM